jgi:hypothetical protein
MKRNRTTLKGYFKKGAIPTEANFADLIDSTLNQEDDRVDKEASQPLKITAAINDADEGLINFYRLVKDNEILTWQIKQNPDGKPGLSIGNDQGSHFFIESKTGNIGIGTTSPTAKLDVNGDVTANGSLKSNSMLVDGVSINGNKGRNYFKDEERKNNEKENGLRVGVAWGMYGIYAEDGPAVVGGVEGVSLQNGAVRVAAGGNVGIGTDSPQKRLHVTATAGSNNPILIENAVANDADAIKTLTPMPNNTILLGGLVGSTLFFYWKYNNQIYAHQLQNAYPIP